MSVEVFPQPLLLTAVELPGPLLEPESDVPVETDVTLELERWLTPGPLVDPVGPLNPKPALRPEPAPALPEPDALFVPRELATLFLASLPGIGPELESFE